MAGYSGKPLWQKLGIKVDCRLCLIAPPDHAHTLLGGAPNWVDVVGGAEIVWLFARDLIDIAKLVPEAFARLGTGDRLWVSWPKKSSMLFVDLTEDDLRHLILPTGRVDVKVCAVDADWSVLKFLKRCAHG